METADLRKILTESFSRDRVEELARTLSVVERQSKVRLWELVLALVLTARTSAGGRQADALRHYRELTGDQELYRGAFYARFNERLAALLQQLLDDALEAVDQLPVLLPPPIATVKDWFIADSTTVKLKDELIFDYLGTGDYAALKVHKLYSLGRHNLTDYVVTDARNHDALHFKVTEAYSGCGVLVDLGYVSHDFLSQAKRHGVSYVIRLKENWKVNVTEVLAGEVAAAAFDEGPFDFASALAGQQLRFKEGQLDLEVTLNVKGKPYQARLVALEIPGKNTCVFLTNLERQRYPAELVGLLYRLRWEVEKDNKLNKSDCNLDDQQGRKTESVHALLFASLLGAVVVNRFICHDHQELFATWQARPHAPLHTRLVAMALATAHVTLAEAMASDAPDHRAWQRTLAIVEGDGRDPNWRRRPSVLDQLFGFTAPPGRPRRQKTIANP